MLEKNQYCIDKIIIVYFSKFSLNITYLLNIFSFLQWINIIKLLTLKYNSILRIIIEFYNNTVSLPKNLVNAPSLIINPESF